MAAVYAKYNYPCFYLLPTWVLTTMTATCYYVADEVTGHHTPWMRIKALMTSPCFVSILTSEWFTYEDCEFFLEEIFEFLHRR